MTGVSPAHFTCTRMGATKSFSPYWIRALMIHISPPSFVTPTMVYLSSFSGVSLPSWMPHQRPLNVALVRASLNLASSSSVLGLDFSPLPGAGVSLGLISVAAAASVFFVSCATVIVAISETRSVMVFIFSFVLCLLQNSALPGSFQIRVADKRQLLAVR